MFAMTQQAVSVASIQHLAHFFCWKLSKLKNVLLIGPRNENEIMNKNLTNEKELKWDWKKMSEKANIWFINKKEKQPNHDRWRLVTVPLVI
jgi:hypothetical protein